ncbi:YcaO-like family protein [Pararhizobium sp. LjRoot238]|uniref:YcaO-like family protein n=1 Tax=Pararhizobium sp. LjRoot238 TaxID=3342293 RepID=UPI003ECF2D14
MEALERVAASTPHCDIVCTSAHTLSSAGKRFDKLPSLIATGQTTAKDDEDISWVAGRDLISGDEIHVPLDAVTLDRTLGGCRYWQSSDGLASGNTSDEATFHGLNERIERDAYVLWQVSGFKARQSSCIHPGSLGCDDISSLVARIESAGLVLRLFDITSDIGVPSFTALVAPVEVISAHRPRFVDVNYGAGTHPSVHKAISRAITEAVQSRMTFISGGRDDIYPSVYPQSLPEETRNLLRAHPSAVCPENFKNLEGGGLGATVDGLRRMGLGPIIAVSLSDPRWPFAVVKVLAPQLENPEGARARRFGARALSKGSFG